jgi:hypothetical protein
VRQVKNPEIALSSPCLTALAFMRAGETSGERLGVV